MSMLTLQIQRYNIDGVHTGLGLLEGAYVRPFLFQIPSDR